MRILGNIFSPTSIFFCILFHTTVTITWNITGSIQYCIISAKDLLQNVAKFISFPSIWICPTLVEYFICLFILEKPEEEFSRYYPFIVSNTSQNPFLHHRYMDFQNCTRGIWQILYLNIFTLPIVSGVLYVVLFLFASFLSYSSSNILNVFLNLKIQFFRLMPMRKQKWSLGPSCRLAEMIIRAIMQVSRNDH